ncbi:MAG: TraX family protein [Christensenellales bacterium]
MLHIIAMTFMLMDHLWATLLPAQDWLTCVGRSRFPSLHLWQWKDISHAQL